MAERSPEAQPDHDPGRVVPLRRTWYRPWRRVSPDILAFISIGILFIDFVERIYHLTPIRPLTIRQSIIVLALFTIQLGIIFRLTQAAAYYHDANPWIRRGYHQHKYSRKARDEFYNGPYYHQHDYAFPFHKYVFRARHKH